MKKLVDKTHDHIRVAFYCEYLDLVRFKSSLVLPGLLHAPIRHLILTTDEQNGRQKEARGRDDGSKLNIPVYSISFTLKLQIANDNRCQSCLVIGHRLPTIHQKYYEWSQTGGYNIMLVWCIFHNSIHYNIGTLDVKIKNKKIQKSTVT